MPGMNIGPYNTTNRSAIPGMNGGCKATHDVTADCDSMHPASCNSNMGVRVTDSLRNQTRDSS